MIDSTVIIAVSICSMAIPLLTGIILAIISRIKGYRGCNMEGAQMMRDSLTVESVWKNPIGDMAVLKTPIIDVHVDGPDFDYGRMAFTQEMYDMVWGR